jgi:hypothetical protein
MFDATPYRVEFIDGGAAVLLEPLTWRTTNTVIRVPAGFRTDGASVPALFWWLVGHPFSYSLLKSATLHDFELETGLAPAAVIHRRFYVSLRSRGNGRLRSSVCFLGAWAGEIRRRVTGKSAVVRDMPTV